MKNGRNYERRTGVKMEGIMKGGYKLTLKY
jgi:hypothetical protein